MTPWYVYFWLIAAGSGTTFALLNLSLAYRDYRHADQADFLLQSAAFYRTRRMLLMAAMIAADLAAGCMAVWGSGPTARVIIIVLLIANLIFKNTKIAGDMQERLKMRRIVRQLLGAGEPTTSATREALHREGQRGGGAP
jgi:hypothetical protein